MDTENRQALFLPQADGGPQLVDVLTTVAPNGSVTPHPQLLMDHIDDGPVMQVCNTTVIDSLKGMNRKFATPFVIFSPRQGRGKSQLQVNRTIRDMVETVPGAPVWRGDAVVLKYENMAFGSVIDCTGSDFPLIRNWLINQAREAS